MASLRVGLFVFLILAIAHIVVANFQRARRLGELEDSWLEEGQPGRWDDYAKAGMEELERSLRQRLIYGVYVLPAGVLGLLTILTIWN